MNSGEFRRNIIPNLTAPLYLSIKTEEYVLEGYHEVDVIFDVGLSSLELVDKSRSICCFCCCCTFCCRDIVENGMRCLRWDVLQGNSPFYWLLLSTYC